MDDDATHMRSAWDAQAENWIAWARAPEHDHFFWRLGLPALLELLPAPGRRTLDLACGEGRVSRVLAERGHDVVGVEGSPALAAAAREASPEIEVLEGDAAAIPLADGAADLVVCSMALLNFDDMDAAVREAARVLEPGGRLCFSTVHPWNSLKSGSDYFAEHTYAEERTRGGLTMTFTDRHRPLGALSRAFEGAGLLVEALREPVPDAAHIAAHPTVEQWTRRPAFLLGAAVKPSRAAS
jgi:SAM-dependent methyltransferase